MSEVLYSGMLVKGPKVEEFEEAFAGYIGCEHAVAVNSGTDALHCALLAHGIGQGDEVITAPFSFVASGMTTGEEGMLTTSDREVAEKARLIRARGSKVRYLHEMLGYNLRMTGIAAAIGLVQLGKLENFNSRRRKNAEFLSGELAGLAGVRTPSVKKGCTHVFHQYTVTVKERDLLADFLGKERIGTGIHYPMTIPDQPLYENLGYGNMMPEAEKAAKEVRSLPVHPGLSGKDLKQISEAVKNFFNEN